MSARLSGTASHLRHLGVYQRSCWPPSSRGEARTCPLSTAQGPPARAARTEISSRRLQAFPPLTRPPGTLLPLCLCLIGAEIAEARWPMLYLPRNLTKQRQVTERYAGYACKPGRAETTGLFCGSRNNNCRDFLAELAEQLAPLHCTE
ncbi:hypothetical protein Bbelb_402500 [Branchiostoma belcheri]|nr:hypothetical protein Bbelb_402500 [Branchiostoma belcheri]